MKHFALIALALCLFVATPVGAYAAGVESDQAPMDVQVWPGAEAGQLLVIVSVVLPEDQQLPATVRLPIVEGMQVLWAGEIGSSQQGDVQRQPNLKKGTGGQYAEFQVTDSRVAQIELGGVPLSQTADGFSARVDFVQTVPVELTSFSARLPGGISEVKITPAPVGEPDRNQVGETLYTLPSKELSPGETQTVSVSYRVGAGPATSTAGGASMSVVLGVLLALIAGAMVVLIFVIARQRMRGADAGGIEEESDEGRGGQ